MGWGHTKLIPALLAGGWDASSQHDQQAVRDLAGANSYEDFEAEVLPYLKMEDPLIDREGDVWKVRAPLDGLVYLGPLIGQKHLERLKTVVTSVFSEIDPSLELPIEERPFASLHGKRLKHSEWLRSGLATTLLLVSEFHDEAGLSVSGIDPKRFVSELVRGLPGLDHDYRAVASLYGELSLLMEASPHPLLEALERLLEGDGSKIKPIFRDNETHPFYSSSPHTWLLWALEALAWDPGYIGRVTLILAKLARVDPGGKLANRPSKSLREIFLPWHPSTNATLVQRLSALDQIIVREPEVGWNLLVELMPEFHSVASPTAKPRYREAGASQRETLTYGLVAKGYNEIIGRLLGLVDEAPERWSTVIKSMASFNPADRLRTVLLLEAFADRAEGQTRTLVWSALRDTVNRHRAFRAAEWAMKEEELARLEAVMRRLQPSDPIGRIAWLFDDHHPDLPIEDGMARLEGVESARCDAIQNLVRSDGVLALLRLAESVKFPQFVARSAASVLESLTDVETLVDGAFGKALSIEFIITLSAGAERKFGDAWRQRVAQLSREAHWTIEQVSQLVLQWSEGSKTWEFISSLGPDIERRYWEQKPAWFLPADANELETAAQKYLHVGRALDAIDALHHRADGLPAHVLLALLDKGIEELNAKPAHVRANLSYELEEIFKSLRRRGGGISSLEIAKREYAYLPILGFDQRTLTIHKLMAEDPGLFVSIVSDVFKPQSGAEAREPTEEQLSRARIGYRLLSEFHCIPGLRDSEMDGEALRNWVAEVRRLAAIQDRARMADEYVGHLLAHAPSDSDGAWPHKMVRDLIEHIASKEVEQGIEIERFNMRGVTTRGPFEGGEQERGLARQAREWAQLTRAWSRTSALLDRVADGWERQAKQEDQDARQDMMRFG